MENRGSITWLGHSCFKVRWEDYLVVFDPYEDGSVPGFGPVRETANMVLCSHEHGDHNFREGITLVDAGKEPPFQVLELSSWHDGEQGARRGANVIRILENDQIRIAHLGDLGCLPSDEELEPLKGVDVLMVPVGGYYTIDAGQARRLVEAVKPRVVIPMHYRGSGFGYDVISPVEDYLKLCGDVIRYPGAELQITRDMPAQTAVLTCQL